MHRASISRFLLVLLLGISIGACTNRAPEPSIEPIGNVSFAVVGVVPVPGLALPVSSERLAYDLAHQLSSRLPDNVMPADVVRATIGAAAHDELRASYARSGRLQPHHVHRLMEANLPASHALLARVEADGVEDLPMESTLVEDVSGAASSQVIRRTFARSRTTRMSARVVDLRNGNLMWVRHFVDAPVASAYIDNAVKPGLSESVMAALPSTVKRDDDTDLYPPAPVLSANLVALLKSIAVAVPTQ